MFMTPIITPLHMNMGNVIKRVYTSVYIYIIINNVPDTYNNIPAYECTYSLNKKEWICSLFKEWILEKSEIRVNLEWIFVLQTICIWRHRRAPSCVGGQTKHCHVRHRQACSQGGKPCKPHRRAGPPGPAHWEAECQCALPAQHVRAARH